MLQSIPVLFLFKTLYVATIVTHNLLKCLSNILLYFLCLCLTPGGVWRNDSIEDPAHPLTDSMPFKILEQDFKAFSLKNLQHFRSASPFGFSFCTIHHLTPRTLHFVSYVSCIASNQYLKEKRMCIYKLISYLSLFTLSLLYIENN